jgi:hypothetical protein
MSVIRITCYDFLDIFAEKFGKNITVFFAPAAASV